MIELTVLPDCRWRGKATVEGRHECRSTKLRHGNNGVRDDLCATCYVRNHEPETAEAIEERRRQQEVLQTSKRVPRGRAAPEEDKSFLVWLGEKATLGKQMLQAYRKWFFAGRPRPTDSEIAERKAACLACPHLQGRNGSSPSCGLCGCPIGRIQLFGGAAGRPGKAEMATEVCPDKPGCGVPGCAGTPRWKSLLKEGKD